MLSFNKIVRDRLTVTSARSGLILTLLVLLLALTPKSPAYAAGIVVTTTADTIDAAGGTCGSVTIASLPGPDGQTSLREALCAAQANAGPDTITFSANGTFFITLTPGTSEDNGAIGDFDISSDVTITGNGSANTIIDGQDQDRVFDLDPLGNCNAATSCTIALSNLTIRNGRAFSSNFNVGGAIYIGSRATVSITNSVIESSSSATTSGGGIQATGVALTLNGVTMQDNVAFSNGGAINAASSLTITNSTFLNNQAEFGGALSLRQGSGRTVSISNSTFSNNRTVTTAGGNSDDGGAIHGETDTTITISGSTFANNTSANNGGGLFLQDASGGTVGAFALTNNTISGNRADAIGGGIYVTSGNAAFTNNTVTQNHSDNNNAGGEVGGGLRVAGGSVTLNNTIVAENYRGSGNTTTDNVNGIVSGSNNLTSGSPLLGPLTNNGGSTQTHALLTGSPAIDTGSNASCPSVDQRGILRPVNGICDIGSYELNDTTPPDTTITGNPTNPSNSTSATFTFTGSDNVTPSGSLAFQCRLDGGGFSTCTSPRTYTGLADGSHTFQVRAIDQANNTDPTPASFTWIVDTTAPNTTITANPTNPSASTTAGFSFTGNDGSGTGVTGFQCQLDGGGFSTCTSPQTYTGLSQGSHTFQVRAIDAAGNGDSTPASYTWVIDTVAPDTTITANPTNPSASANASFSFTGNDGSGSGVAGFECQLDGGGFSTCTSPQTYTGLANGSHTFQVRAVDIANNRDSTPASFTWTVDPTPPNATITANPTNPSNSSSASFSFSGTDNVTPAGSLTFECKLDSGSFAACTSPESYSSLADGSHTFQVRAVDGAGNTDPTPASYTWTVDTTAPTAALSSAAPNPTNTSPIPVTVTFNESVSGFTAGDITTSNGTVNNFAGSGTTYTFDLVPSGQGLVTADIAAGVTQDAAGNGNTAVTQFSRTYDSVGPSAVFSSAAPNPANTSPIPVTVTFSENVSGFTAGDITAGNATVSNFAGSGATYTFDLIPNGVGLVTADIAAGVTQDAASNPNAAATQFSRTFVASEIALLGNNILIPNGDTTPSLADQTDFDSVAFGGAITRTFTISNSGRADLNLSGSPLVALSGAAAGDFSIVANPVTPVISNTSTTFQARFAPSVAGTRVATVTIANNDSDENPYTFAISGVGISSNSGINTIYLPILLRNSISAPDLVIDSLSASSSGVTLVIRNAGNAPVEDAFWVDVYFNPTSTPTLNKRWQDIASHGQVWGIQGAALPLDPGESLTLTGGDAYYFPQLSSTPPLPVGASAFVLADSVDFSTTYGAVRESNEANNLTGPVISTVAGGPSSVLSLHETAGRSLEGLPPR